MTGKDATVLMRVATLIAGLGTGAGLSQFPEYSQQYMQRLGGSVDALATIVTQFDADAHATGLTRETALTQLAQSGDFGARRATAMTTTMERHDRLAADLAVLRGAGPFTRLYRMPARIDSEIASAAMADYRAALPLTFEGLVMAGFGMLIGSALIKSLLALLRGLWPNRAPSRRASRIS